MNTPLAPSWPTAQPWLLLVALETLQGACPASGSLPSSLSLLAASRGQNCQPTLRAARLATSTDRRSLLTSVASAAGTTDALQRRRPGRAARRPPPAPSSLCCSSSSAGRQLLQRLPLRRREEPSPSRDRVQRLSSGFPANAADGAVAEESVATWGFGEQTRERLTPQPAGDRPGVHGHCPYSSPERGKEAFAAPSLREVRAEVLYAAVSEVQAASPVSPRHWRLFRLPLGSDLQPTGARSGCWAGGSGEHNVTNLPLHPGRRPAGPGLRTRRPRPREEEDDPRAQLREGTQAAQVHCPPTGHLPPTGARKGLVRSS